MSLKMNQRPSGKRGRKEALTQIPSPGIQIVTQTVQDNGPVNKKLKFLSTSLFLPMQGSLGVEEKNMWAQK